MLKRLIALLVAASFIMSSPALAVEKIPKKPKKQTASSGQASDQEKAPKKETSLKQEPKPTPDRSSRPVPAPERRRFKQKDRFIDEDSDGINDRLRKPPTVKKKKKESRPKKAETKRRPPPKKAEIQRRPR